jgi:precorrin-6Y C5,15-methyltransferase (decarboxylating)
LVLWDIGAGSGSVAIEASRVTNLQQVVAVEKDPERFQQLQQNIQEFGSGDLVAVHGAAPEALSELTDPHRVFIGGSGGNLTAIMDEVSRRLQPRGRVVQTAVTLDSLNEILSFWRDRGWQVSVSELQVSRSVPIGNSVRLEALNPVFIVSSWAAGDSPARARPQRP